MSDMFNKEYFIDKIERHVKNEINIFIYSQYKRYPTKEEYEGKPEEEYSYRNQQ